MRRWTRFMLLMPVLAIVQALSSCSTIDGPDDNDNSLVKASLAFTVSSTAGATTRMDDAVVQEQPENGRSYRGLGEVYPIPFAISGEQITSSDHSSRLLQQASLTDSHEPQTGNYGGFYLYNAYTLIRGINAFLVYAKAGNTGVSVPSGVSDKAYFGSLQYPALLYPDITTLRFSPEPIYKGTDAPAAASTLAGYLSNIANTPGWSTTTDPTLKLLYKVFTGQENDGNVMVMAGASVNVMALANSLYALMSQLTFTGDGDEATIQKGILNRIQNYTAKELTLTNNSQTGTAWRLTAVKVDGKDYPSSLNLPDGAAALRWEKISETEYGFKPQTVTTTLANINNINRWCYPPELFYYANSRIDTSNKEVDNSVYTSATDWDGNDGVLSKYENKNAYVSGDTKGIAIQKPLQYAVGRLKVTLQKVTTGSLMDDAGKQISLTNTESNPSFPLTGIIICNQHPVGFDFKPVLNNGAASHADDHFVYDSQVGTSCCLSSTEDYSVQSTLVLQTYDTGEGDEKDQAEEVIIALEFRNDSGVEFRGKGGVIYPGTKFYLMGKIDPTQGSTTNTAPEAQGRVFTKDFVTTVSTKVESLANAYNVLPNILGGRLELGVELTPNWIQAETTNVILE